MSSVIFDDRHFWIVSENTWNMHFLVFYLEVMHFWDMHFSLKLCTFPWSYALLACYFNPFFKTWINCLLAFGILLGIKLQFILWECDSKNYFNLICTYSGKQAHDLMSLSCSLDKNKRAWLGLNISWVMEFLAGEYKISLILSWI